MNALTKIENTALSAMSEGELVQVLQTSLYPGAKLESIKMVLGYCKASGLDPMQKPVHIVPMKVSTGQKDDRGWDIKEDRDVIMPGVGLYRTQASRSGQYAGVSDPEFGPTRTLTFQTEKWVEDEQGRRRKMTTEAKIEYPEWCRVSVTRIVNGDPREFSAREYWLENYATKGANSEEPNAMWKKRPFGQIAKCAEAQALRKAFPEMTGSQPTAEEMEGKSFNQDDDRVIDATPRTPPPPPPAPTAPPPLPEFTEENLNARLSKIAEFYKAGKDADQIIAFYAQKAVLSEDMRQRIRKLAPVVPIVTYAALAERLHKCDDADTAALIVDEGRALPEDQRQELDAIFTSKFRPQG